LRAGSPDVSLATTSPTKTGRCPLRITLTVHQFPPNYFTGTEQYVLNVGRELQRRGHDVDVFSLEPAFGEATGPWRETREEVQGLPVRRINFWQNIGRDWRRMEYRHPYMAEVFAAHIRERKTDVVHSFHLRYLGADLIDRVVEQGRGLVVSLMDFWFICPRVILMKSDGTACDGPPDGGRGCLPCHTPELSEELQQSPIAAEIDRLHVASRGESQPQWALRHRVATMLERPAYLRERLAKAHTIVAPTEFLRGVFLKNGAPEERIRHLSYGVDTGALADEVARARPAQRPLTFGFFGTYSPHKGPNVLVEAMTQVKGECRALLRGRKSDFAEYSAALVAAAEQDERITVAGPFAREELAQALAQIDVLVVPSTWHENAPFVVLEARAAGLPVLASRFGGLVEVVDDEVDGELFAPGNASDLAARLQRLLDEPDRLARYRDAVQPPKSLQTAVDEFESIYAAAAPTTEAAR
jgi:glycosyltransferase involved in cell wall biosynthesis